MIRVALLGPVLAIVSCSSPSGGAEAAIIAAVKDAAGGAPELQVAINGWCPITVDGARVAHVAAGGPVTAGATTGSGGYLVEVGKDGTVRATAKASPPTESVDPEALRLDRTYCEGRFVDAPMQAMQKLHDMQQGTYDNLP